MVECEDAGFKAGKVFTTPLIIESALVEFWLTSSTFSFYLPVNLSESDIDSLFRA